jgi:predicted HTH domain antitoxin
LIAWHIPTKTMQLLVDIPTYLPDAAQCTPQQFMQDAKLAMAIKLFEMKRLSSGMAASLIGVTRVQFLGELNRFGVSMIDLDENDLAQDFLNA